MSNYRKNDLERFAEMFKALANPHRLAIFLRLISCCPPGTGGVSDAEARRFVGQLGEELDIAASTLSHHIKELRRAGLLRVERRGKNIECRVDPEVVTELLGLLAGRIPEGLIPEGHRPQPESCGEECPCAVRMPVPPPAKPFPHKGE